MRYDIYINFFSKCPKMKLRIDKDKSSKLMSFVNIEKDLQTIEEHVAMHKPNNIKHRILFLAYIVFMFVISWETSILAVVGFVCIIMLQLLVKHLSDRVKTRTQSHRSKMLGVALDSFQTDQNKYHKYAC